jgi:hypothetical protein
VYIYNKLRHVVGVGAAIGPGGVDATPAKRTVKVRR